MIERLYIKDNLIFKEVDLKFNNGLIVFTGASGAGKSVLFETILGLFGIKEARAALSEITLDNKIEIDGYNVDDITIFKQIKKDKIRYFLNDNSISKKRVYAIASNFIKFLSLKDFSDFNNSVLLNSIDKLIISEDKNYEKIIKEYSENYYKYKEITKELATIEEEEKKIEELKEFTAYEIKKIEDISPSIDEYDKLNILKKDISKKDKILKAIDKAQPIFEYEDYVNNVFTLIEKSNDNFVESMNEIRILFEDEQSRLETLSDDLDIESILDRIEMISSLIKKYGSVEDCLVYLETKKNELAKYENISYEKDKLLKLHEEMSKRINNLADKISNKRAKITQKYQLVANEFIEKLHLKDLSIQLVKSELNSMGHDSVEILLNSVDMKKISSGEFNRVRLALIATRTQIDKSNNGILILDEIDANLSGVESESVANVLKFLSSNYQIFSISHQPQLTAIANQHFVVSKIDNTSTVSEIKGELRVNEIARMISGQNITEDAISFAKGLLAISIS